MSSGITRKKGQSGKAVVVQCIQCGKMIRAQSCGEA